MDHILSMPAQPLDVAPFGARLTGARSVVLFKAEDLEVIRIVLRKGQALPPHRVAGSVSLQCLEGSLEVMLGQNLHKLQRAPGFAACGASAGGFLSPCHHRAVRRLSD